jgi:cobalt-precorrin 5A hydrolase
MKTAIISFNKQGEELAEKFKTNINAELYIKSDYNNCTLSELIGELMGKYKALIFISSTGIAVRAIAPYIKSKDIDPAVIVIDILGKFVISLLSGHLGGANELAAKIADIIKAELIITTATDNLGLVAPDIIAKENNLVIDDLKKAKKIASLLVEGKKVAFFDEENKIKVPKGYTDNLEEAQGVVHVTNKINKDSNLDMLEQSRLQLIRRNIILGIGCRKSYSPEKMRNIVLEKLDEFNIDKRSVKTIATVEVKKDETAIIELSQYLKAELKISTLEEIKTIQDKYKGSDFVEKSIGVRAVCEPCVELAGGIHLTNKISCEGMTICIGRE